MTVIGILSFLVSITGMVSFLIWDEGLRSVPVLYPFGQFLAEWWFHNYTKTVRGKYGTFKKDDPPLVAYPYTLQNTGFPYNAVEPAGINEVGSTALSYFQTPKTDMKKFTPVDGIGGVTSSKEVAESNPDIYSWYPDAISKTDYITARIMGTGSTYDDWITQGELPHNTRVFKAGTPFGAQNMDANDPNNEKWTELPVYQAAVANGGFWAPLASKGVGDNMVMYEGPTGYGSSIYSVGVNTDTNQYSGGEYNSTDNVYDGSREQAYLQSVWGGARPPWYAQNQYGTPITGKDIQAYTGEFINTEIYSNTSSMQNIVLPSFNDTHAGTVISGNPQFTVVPWGQNEDVTQSAAGSTNGQGTNTGTMKSDYINNFLAQSNPIPSSFV